MKIRKIAQTPGVVATVVDNLESESAVDALSAKQGKELKNLIENIEPVSQGALENFPIGTTVQYDGDTVPEGWEAVEIDDIKVSTDEPVNGEKVWIKKSKNLWNAKQVKTASNYIVANGTGIKLIKTSTGRVSGVYDLNLKAGKTYCISCKRTSYTTTDGTLYCIWYNKDGGSKWVPSIDSEEVLFTPTEDIYRMQFYIQPTEADGTYVEIEDLQVEEGTEATAYEPYEKQAIYVKEEGEYKEYIKPQIKIGPTEPTNEDMWIKKGKNLFNINEYLKNTNVGYGLVNVLEVGKTYTISFTNVGGNKYGILIKGPAVGSVEDDTMSITYTTTGPVTFTYTQTMRDNGYMLWITTIVDYLPITKEHATQMKIQIEEGTEATAYESYVEKELYVKNANGVFELFTNNTEHTTTGVECVTNEILDGKRVYKKRINCGALPNTTTKNVNTGLSNSINVIKIEGVAIHDGAAVALPLSSATRVESNVYFGFVNNNISISTGSDYSSYTGYATIYYTKN